jgi:hypothetical protein
MSYVSSTLEVYQKIKVNKLSPQDSFVIIKVQLSLCMPTAKMGRCSSKILWEALLVKQRVSVARKDRKNDWDKRIQ